MPAVRAVGVPVAAPVAVDAAASPRPGHDTEALLEQFLVSIIALAGAQAGAVRVSTDDGQHLRLVAQRGLPQQLARNEVLVDRNCGICGVAAGTDTLVWVDDIAVLRAQYRPGLFRPAMPARAGDLAAARQARFWASTPCSSTRTCAA